MTLNFQGQIWNLLYLSQKWSDCHETKSKHIDWNLGLKCDHYLWPWQWPLPWIVKVKHQICYLSAKIVWLPRNKKQTYQWNSRPQMWPSPLTLAMNLTLIFQGQICNLLYLSPKWSDCHEMKSKHIDWTLGLKWPSGLTLAMSFTLNFQGQIWNLLYLYPKRSDYHETKSKHIEWTPGFKCDQWVWPWQWPWSLNSQGQMWPMLLTIRMVLTKDFHLVRKVRWKDLP